MEFEKMRDFLVRVDSKGVKQKLSDMSDEWLQGVIDWYLSIPWDKRVKQISDDHLLLYIQEKQYRIEKEI